MLGPLDSATMGELKHLVLVKFKEGVQVEDILKSLNKMASEIDVIKSFEWSVATSWGPSRDFHIGNYCGVGRVALDKKWSISSIPQEKDDSKELVSEGSGCQKIPIKEIYAATNDLNALNFIGQGIAGTSHPSWYQDAP
ncbi:uncharacterized protein LOC143884625 isoform X2 [Tasmannia lanceolata]|uniref:uncharacterized protein LOC143884625 isoform X2 n=1 Tax=Tasmannia lanceolata TaxID=3420 RepID=UPI004062F9AF